MYKLSDFKKGQTAYIRLTGNASQGKSGSDLIRECVVESVGRKYITAGGIKFEEHNLSYGGLKQSTNYCVDYVLYSSRQEIEDMFERRRIVEYIRKRFERRARGAGQEYTLEQLRKVKEILEEIEEEL